VGRRVATDDSVTAKVRGTSSYKVKLWVECGEQCELSDSARAITVVHNFMLR
jgi:hypothetical protein